MLYCTSKQIFFLLDTNDFCTTGAKFMTSNSLHILTELLHKHGFHWSEYITQICSGITRSRVLNGEFCTQMFQDLIYLHLFTKLFHEDLFSIVSIHTVGVSQPYKCLIWTERGWDLSSSEVAFIKCVPVHSCLKVVGLFRSL